MLAGGSVNRLVTWLVWLVCVCMRKCLCMCVCVCVWVGGWVGGCAHVFMQAFVHMRERGR